MIRVLLALESPMASMALAKIWPRPLCLKVQAVN